MKTTLLTSFRFQRSRSLATVGITLFSMACISVSGHAATILDLGSLVRPDDPTPNAFVSGATTYAVPTTATLEGNPPSGLELVSRGGQLVVYFDPVALEVGQTIAFHFTATLSNFNAYTGGLRIGFFEREEGAKVLAEDANNSADFRKYTGYVVSNAAGTTATSNGSIFQKPSTTVDLVSPTNGLVLVNTLPALGGINGQSYSGSFSIHYQSADALALIWQFGSLEAHTVYHTGAGITTQFDTLGVMISNNASGTAVGSVADFSVFQVEVIPEPSLVLMAAGFIGLLIWRRRR